MSASSHNAAATIAWVLPRSKNAVLNNLHSGLFLWVTINNATQMNMKNFHLKLLIAFTLAINRRRMA
jgi:hypothetical protein